MSVASCAPAVIGSAMIPSVNTARTTRACMEILLWRWSVVETCVIGRLILSVRRNGRQCQWDRCEWAARTLLLGPGWDDCSGRSLLVLAPAANIGFRSPRVKLAVDFHSHE